jgi:hypothetical protein
MPSPRRRERRFRDRGPALNEVQGRSRDWRTTLERGCAGSVDEEQRARDHDIRERWQRAEDKDLSVEAGRAREKLEALGRVR